MKRSRLRNRIEAVLARTAFALLGAMPVDLASAVGGWLGRTIGYRLPVTRRGRRNLAAAFPGMGEAEREMLLRRMWDNLGRTAAEFPHVPAMPVGPGRRIEVEGAGHVAMARAAGRPIIVFGAHCANWELAGPVATWCGVAINLIYRAPNNPYLERLFTLRGNSGEMIPKGRLGARRALELLQQGEALALLVDQKMNDGIPVPFFGRDAMTAPALAQFALKFRCVVLPVQVERLVGARFRVVIHPPLNLPDTRDRHADVRTIMTEVNRIIEGWVRAHPEQWLWLHKRWPN